MKKLSSVLLAALMTLLLSVSVFAADEIEIPLDAEHVGIVTNVLEDVSVDRLYFHDGEITADGVTLFSLYLPEEVPLGETVIVHIKGTCLDDFRVWLLAKEESADRGMQATFSNQWRASEHVMPPPVTFDSYIEFTAEDFDEQGGTAADRVAIKASDWGSTLGQFNLMYLGVIYGSMEEVVADAQHYADVAADALETAKAANGDENVLKAALADAEAAVEALTEKSALGLPEINEMLADAESAVEEIYDSLTEPEARKVLETIQDDIDAVNKALKSAKAAGSDTDAIYIALADARVSAERIAAVADTCDYKLVKTASSDADSAVKDIESILKRAQRQKKDEEEKAANEAQAERRKMKTIAIVAVVFAILLVLIVSAVSAVTIMRTKNRKK